VCENPKLWEPSGAHCRSLGFARDDKGEGSAFIDEGDWDGRVPCAASVERSLSIRITKPNESVKSIFVIPSEAEGSVVRPGWLPKLPVLTHAPILGEGTSITGRIPAGGTVSPYNGGKRQMVGY
jgi:hypothetical protein